MQMSVEFQLEEIHIFIHEMEKKNFMLITYLSVRIFKKLIKITKHHTLKGNLYLT